MRKTTIIGAVCTAALALWAHASGSATPEPQALLPYSHPTDIDTLAYEDDSQYFVVANEFIDTITARDALFVGLEDMLDIIPPSAMLDMMDYYDVDSIRPTHNRLDGLSSLTALTDDFAEVDVTKVSRFQARILPLKKKSKTSRQIMLMAYTVGNDRIPRDTRLMISDIRSTLPLEKYLTAPEAKDFFAVPKGDKVKVEELVDMIPFTAVEYVLSPDDNTLRARLTSVSLASLEDKPRLDRYLIPELVYDWNGSRFVKKN